MTTPTPSEHHTPHPVNWADEINQLLSLWSAQINAAIVESHSELESISDSYFVVAREAIEALKVDTPEAIESTMLVEQHINTAMVKFQVSDRLMQRMENVRANLLVLGDYFEKNAQSGSEVCWRKTLETIRSGYTMAAERRMFDAVLNQADTQEGEAESDDIEETGVRVSLF